MAAQVKPAKKQPPAAAETLVRFDDAGMQTSYANVCHVAGGREEFSLLFGTNQNWQPDGRARVKLEQRLVLTPASAKRLTALLGRVIHEYESRFGEISLEMPAAPEGDA